ncbi:hypothetical protein QBC37DRAFT_430765 [Rhypophila decipiens]|uniref:Oxidoreductase n=1 Tax=Rhypophila decipiens TaxID=261697 RepID=A0AAN7B1E4_9PEZI|nr:hypothetical protein QBC37DRAFT_430765 [Rhypophila decipiens]
MATTQKQFNVGIVGYGLSAKVFHIPFVNLTPSLKLHSIVQRSPSGGPDSAPATYPALKHHTTIEPLLADAEVDIVILCTPPQTHFHLASDALRAGKHVLVEKPFVPSSDEAVTLAKLAREKGLILGVYQNRRFDSDFLTVKELLEGDKLGRIVEFETHFDRLRLEKPSTWKGTLGMDQGGGVLFDLGSHLLDQVYVLFGKPSFVKGWFVNQREGRFVSGQGGQEEEPDSVTVMLTYQERGLLVFVRIGVASVEKTQPRFWVRGTKGSYVKTGLDPQEDQLRGGTVKADDEDEFGWESEDKYGKVCLVGDDGKIDEMVWPTLGPPLTYKKFYELFAKAVETGREEDIPVSGWDAAEVLKIIEAVRESVKMGRDVVPK